jgi:DNA-directed RNA polymerase specialized sigma24 family protein
MSLLDSQPGRPPAPPADARQELCRRWYEEHGRAIYSYLRFQLGSADEADDLTADVFLRAVRSADRFDPVRGTARSWLFRIAQNVLRDHGRRERRRRLVPLSGFRDLHTDAPRRRSRCSGGRKSAACWKPSPSSRHPTASW